MADINILETISLYENEKNENKQTIFEEMEEIIKKYSNEENSEENFSFEKILNDLNLHTEFINKVNKNLNKKFYKTIEELKEEQDIKAFEDIMGNINDSITLDKKQKIMKEYFIIPSTDNKTQKRMIGLAIPTIQAVNFYFDEYYFISVEIINKLLGVKSLSFLDEEEGKVDISDPQVNLMKLLTYMDTEGISDLHLQPISNNYYKFTGRINGTMKVLSNTPHIQRKIAEGLISILKRKAGVEQLSRHKEVKASFKEKLNNGRTKLFRLSIGELKIDNILSYSVSIRRLSSAEQMKNIENLGYPPEIIKFFKEVIPNLKNGLSLYSGETNSGKTTSLYSWLRLFAEKHNKRVLTIEDPREYEMPDLFIQFDLTDTEYAEDKQKITMDDIIPLMLRHDPDIAMLSELRTAQAVDKSLELASTGHVSLSTIHANNCNDTIKRLMTLGKKSENDIKKLIQVIVHQELIDKKCQECEDGYVIQKGIKVFCKFCNEDGKALNPGNSGVLPLPEISYFFNINEDDNILDFEYLKRENKMIFIPKEYSLNFYYKNKMITKETYEHEMGLNKEKFIEKYSNLIKEFSSESNEEINIENKE